jgi:hypothetical protein
MVVWFVKKKRFSKCIYLGVACKSNIHNLKNVLAITERMQKNDYAMDTMPTLFLICCTFLHSAEVKKGYSYTSIHPLGQLGL